MATDHQDPGVLRDIIARAIAIADEQAHHLIGALLAQCLEELHKPEL